MKTRGEQRLRSLLAPFAWAAPLFTWQALFLFAPTVMLFLMSFWSVREFNIVHEYTFRNWKGVITGPDFWEVAVRTMILSTVTALLTFAIVFPFAYALAFKVSTTVRHIAMALLVVPFFTAYLLRIYAWQFILIENGPFNWALGLVGLGPISLLGTQTAIVIGYLANFLPLITIVMLLSLLSVDRRMIEAANNLGIGRIRTVFTVVLPAAKVGVILSISFAFILAFGDPAAPDVLGLGRLRMLPNMVTAEIQGGVNFPAAAVVAVMMIVLILAATLVATVIAFPPTRKAKVRSEETVVGVTRVAAVATKQGTPSSAAVDRPSQGSAVRLRYRESPLSAWWNGNPRRALVGDRWMDRLSTIALRAYIVLCFAFVYVPLATFVFLSFSEPRFPAFPVKDFSFKWYATIPDDPDLTQAFKNSVVIALIVAVVATTLGAMAAYFLNRWEWKGRNAYLILVLIGPTIPLVVLGFSMFIWFRELGIDGGIPAVVLAHIGYAAAFGVGIIRMRLLEMDRNLEKAAWNLGANTLNAVFRVVVPMALPTLIAAFFLTMAVSWNEFVIAWFVSGLSPTLPVKIYFFFAGNISPQINAIGTIVLAASFVLLVLAIVFAFVVASRTTGGSRPPADQEAGSRDQR